MILFFMQDNWEQFYKSKNYFHLEPHEALDSFAQKCEDRGINEILDLGCGAGNDLLFLAEKGFLVTGVDFSPSACANAEDLLQSKNLPGKVYIDNLFDKVTTFGPEEFPAVIAINALEYTDETTFHTVISDISRILSEKGLFFLVVSSENSKIDLEMSEQLFFTAEQLEQIVQKRFNVLDFMQDSKENLVYFLEKK